MTAVTDSLFDVFRALGVALAIGLLVGFERGWAQRGVRTGERVAGLRTFGIVGLLGGVAALLGRELAPVVLGLAFLAMAGVLIAAHVTSSPRTKDYGITSEVAALATFALGATAVAGFPAPAAAAAVVVAVLLGFKAELHEWIERLDRDELVAALQLLLISVVVLPLLPDRGYGPWQAINPYRLWWLVVLIAGIAFVGHFSTRLVGAKRGILLTGFFGGLASSTALTLNFARMGREHPALHGVLATGVILAGGTVFPRMLFEVGVINRALLPRAGIALGTMAVVTYLAALAGWLATRRRTVSDSAEGGQAFQLGIALKFAALLAVISLLSEAMRAWFGDAGIYALALVSGIGDVDAITLSLAHMARQSLAPEVAVTAMVIAAVTNTVVKAGMVLFIARGRMALVVGLVAVLVATTGIVVVLIL